LAAQPLSIFDRFEVGNAFDVLEGFEVYLSPGEVGLVLVVEGPPPHQLSIRQMYENQKKALQRLLEFALPWAMTKTRRR
jgi:hypothetical protein